LGTATELVVVPVLDEVDFSNDLLASEVASIAALIASIDAKEITLTCSLLVGFDINDDDDDDDDDDDVVSELLLLNDVTLTGIGGDDISLALF